MLGSFNDCNIINFTNKVISSEDFYYIHKIVLDGVNDNMESLVQISKYVEKNEAFFIRNALDIFTLQEVTTIDDQVSKAR